MSDFWSITVPGYTTGVATVALVAVTAWTVLADRRRAARREKDEAIRDARTVFAYAEMPPAKQLPRPPKGSADDFPRLIVVNAGGDPIFNVELSGERLPADKTDRGVFWIPGVHQVGVPFVLPGGRDSVIGSWRRGRGVFSREAKLLYWEWDFLPVTVEWSDGRGFRWRRVGNQRPEPATASSFALRMGETGKPLE